MEYRNYIFDLYATLIDIHTNQKPLPFWRKVSAVMNAYGAVYEPAEMRKKYREVIKEEERALAEACRTEFPEVDIGNVFLRLLLEAPILRKDGIWGDPRTWDSETVGRWCSSFAESFRIMSRIRFALYPDTIGTLVRLRNEGKHVYLLSNAQSLFTRPEMEELGLFPYFEDVFISSEHRMRKPEVRFMEELLEKHGLDPKETVMVGNDMKSDIEMAARCGVNAFLVNHDGYSEEEIRNGFERARAEAPRSVILESGFLKDLK